MHSFPTNSILLKGLIQFLGDYFNVYFIDLPGFTKITPLVKGKVSLNFYANYLSIKIKELRLDSYVIGGISFGFIIVNQAKLDPKKCKAILAIEPYINSKFLNLSQFQKFLYLLLLDDIFTSQIQKKLWLSPYAEDIFGFILGKSDKLKTVLKELDHRAFFQTAKILIKYNKQPKYKKNIPYVLWINLHDETIKAAEIINELQRNTNHLLIKFNDVEHYPKDVSKAYFKSKVKKADILETIEWVNYHYKMVESRKR